MSEGSANLCPGWDPSRDWTYYLQLWMVTMIVEATAYGVFLCLIILSSYIMISQGLGQSPARIVLFVTTIVMFSISTAHLVLHLFWYIMEYPYICAIITPPELIAKKNQIWSAVNLLERAQYLISDSVVVWRAWVIWQGNRWVRGSLLFGLFATAATSIALAVLNVLSFEKGVRGNPLEWNMLGTFALLVTNLGATLAIAYKVWEYRRTVKTLLHRGDSKTRVENVLTLLVESGAIYCVYWILIFPGDFGLYGDFEFEWPQPHISGIYPTLIILLVALQRSTSDTVFSLSIPTTPVDMEPPTFRVFTTKYAPKPEHSRSDSASDTDLTEASVSTAVEVEAV